MIAKNSVFAKEVGLIHGPTYFSLSLARDGNRGCVHLRRSFLLFKLTSFITQLRVTKEEESIGLDISQHTETLEAG